MSYEGSGGASPKKLTNIGGAGGGIIWLSALDTTRLKNTLLAADGADAKRAQEGQSAGGGAGGSIQIITTNLKGTGEISTQGGNGSFGGGGGSGGRVFVNFLRGFTISAQPEQSHFWFRVHKNSLTEDTFLAIKGN